MQIYRLCLYYLFFFFHLSLCPVLAEDSVSEGAFFSGTEGNKYVYTEIVFDVESYRHNSKKPLRIGILFTIEPDWHIYWKYPGESGKPTSISWRLPEGWQTEDLKWPLPRRTLERGDINTLAYSGQVLIYTTLIPPSDISDLSSLTIDADVSWLVCYDRCVPGKSSIQATLPISEKAPVISDANFHFEKTKRTVPKAVSGSDQLKEHGILAFLAESTNENTAGLYFELRQTRPARAQFFENTPYPLVHSPMTAVNSKEHTVLHVPLSETESGSTPGGVIAFEVEDTRRFIFEIPPLPFTEISAPATDSVPPESDFSESDFMRHSYKDSEPASPAASTEVLPESSFMTLLIALLSAFVGGIILNIMPCVLPILSIKLMGIISAKEKNTSENIRDALWFSAGILSSFLLLAVVAVSLKTAGHALGWGFQFQYPGFIFSLVIVLFILSLGFFDLYIAEIPFLNKLTRLSPSNEPSGSGKSKHFFDGILVSALSTPCTAPFLGTALIFAFTQSVTGLFLVFIAIGTGLAAPYLLVVSQPRLLRLFPKPGNWMNRIKQLMGFALLATIIWLLKVLESSVPGSAFRGTGILLALYMFFWFWSWSKEQKSPFAKSVLFIIGLSVPVASWIYLNPLARHQISEGSIEWKEYDSSLLDTDAPVFIDFTAEWCITCKYNENFILSKQRIRTRFNELGVIPIKADWTTGSDEITELLERYDGTGVPHYVYLPEKDAPHVVLPTILTEDIVLKTVK
jgi:thiol:disulfide interchange protein/DsbC/DsbD-like thiol-disulfide interchange protein